MPPAYEILLLNTTIPQIQAAQSGDTYVVPRDIAFSTVASFAAGTAALPSIVATGDTNTGIWFPAADTFAISTAGTERARIDSSGNLGLGVTPSGWYSTTKAIDINSGGAIYGGTTGFGIAVSVAGNSYWNGSAASTYKTTGNATDYRQTFDGKHAWYTAPSGTAGNAISFTQAMTLDASGNLVIGRTSGNLSGGSAGSQILTVSASAAGRNGILELNGTRSTSGDYVGYVRFFNNAAATPVADIQTIRGASDTEGTLAFATSNIERARITSGGEFLVGTNNTSVPTNGVKLDPASGSSVSVGHASGTTSGTYYDVYLYDGTIIGSVSQNGTTGVLYNITSDYRLKNVVGAVTDAGARIDALKPIDYTWKADGSAARGFLAHEFQAVYPNSVTGTKDAVDEEGKPVYQNMQASTSEVIADLVAELQSLRARVAQLESKGV